MPRPSIADLMGLTVLVALDCLAFVTVDALEDTAYFGLFFGALPLGNVLVVSLVVLARMWRGGESAAFLAGFQAVGWMILALHALWAVRDPDTWRTTFLPIENRLIPLVHSHPPVGWGLAMGVFMATLVLPQLFAASLGGVLWRLAMERRPHFPYTSSQPRVK
ncbi:MAG TPA: hypothetical protein VGH33_14580 [Isosphaeraceae bacterium]